MWLLTMDHNQSTKHQLIGDEFVTMKLFVATGRIGDCRLEVALGPGSVRIGVGVCGVGAPGGGSGSESIIIDGFWGESKMGNSSVLMDLDLD